MKSPTIQTFAIAIVFTVIAFCVTKVTDVNATILLALVFISAFLAPLFTSSKISNDNTEKVDSRTLYVGNLPYRANETAVRELFSEHGTVHSVRLMKDKHTGKRRGFGFVEMASKDLDKAIEALNDTEFQQRTLKVREAKERPERPEENRAQ